MRQHRDNLVGITRTNKNIIWLKRANMEKFIELDKLVLPNVCIKFGRQVGP